MVKGSLAKQEITKKILETFEDSFVNEKEIRIPFNEDGELVQIKVTLTCAKVNIEKGAENALPSSTEASPAAANLTEEEKEETNELLKSLNLL